MSLKICSLGSGSKGNSTLLTTATTRILVDCGFGLKDIVSRLKSRGIEPEQLDAILVTHEHGDHASGVTRLSNRYQIPVFSSRGTLLHSCFDKLDHYHILVAEREFSIGDLTIFPFTVPHDAREPIQFVFRNNKSTVGLVTDLGHVTPHICEVLAECSGLLLEFNHDRQMLLNGRYPPSLKKRIIGQLGHLSNEQAAELLSQIHHQGLNKVVALHLSEENNRVELVEAILKSYPKLEYTIASQGKGSEWYAF
jgi:phosphoribosyl 1,2-cyclic phosphodiesterase